MIGKNEFFNDNFLKHKSYIKVKMLYRAKYKSKQVPTAPVIFNIVNIYNKTGSVCLRRFLARTRTVQTEDFLIFIKYFYLGDPKLLFSKASNLVPISVSTIQNVPRKYINIKNNKFENQ